MFFCNLIIGLKIITRTKTAAYNNSMLLDSHQTPPPTVYNNYCVQQLYFRVNMELYNIFVVHDTVLYTYRIQQNNRGGKFSQLEQK